MTYKEAKKIKVGNRMVTYKMHPDFEFIVVNKEVQNKDVFFVTEQGQRIHHRNVAGFVPTKIQAFDFKKLLEEKANKGINFISIAEMVLK